MCADVYQILLLVFHSKKAISIASWKGQNKKDSIWRYKKASILQRLRLG